jgi:hypothetical protein
VVLIRGKVSSKDRDGNAGQEVKIMVDDAREVTTAQASAYQATGKKPKTPKPKAIKSVGAAAKTSETPAPERVYIRLASSEDEKVLRTLKQTLDSFQGQTDVILVLGEAAQKQVVKLPTGIDKESDGLERLRELVGADNLKIQ